MLKHNRLFAHPVLLGSAAVVMTIAGVAATVAATTSGQMTGPGMTAGTTTDIEKAEQMVVVTTIPPGYRDWKFVSAAHEAGELNDIRVVIGNDKAITAYRAGKPFPEGSIVGRVAWKMVPSEENNRTFGQAQSFVPGDAPTGTCNSWRRTPRNTRQRAVGVTQISEKISSLSLTKRRCTLALNVTRLSRRATTSSRNTRPSR